MTQEALKLALEALKEADEIEFWNKQKQAITAIKEALAQEQEPWCMKMNGCKTKCEDCPDEPPQRTWVGLEGEEIRNLWEEATKPDRSTMTMVTSFAKSIEAKLKEMNN